VLGVLADVGVGVGVGVGGIGTGGRTRCIEYSVDCCLQHIIFPLNETLTSTGSNTVCSVRSSFAIGFPQ
jgi:hypothetical protein